MNKILKKLIGTGVLVAALGSGGASAAFINGGISFSDGFDTLGNPPGSLLNIVSQLVFVNVDNGPSTLAQGCSGDFGGCPALGAFATDFLIGAAPVPMIYTYGGFTFVIPAAGFGAPTRTALSCNGTSCVDFLTFTATGVVSKAGFDDTAFTLNWTGQGSCVQAVGAAQCASAITASWSSSITALGSNTAPEPGSLALIGIALAGLALIRRRKQT